LNGSTRSTATSQDFLQEIKKNKARERIEWFVGNLAGDPNVVEVRKHIPDTGKTVVGIVNGRQNDPEKRREGVCTS
jgi:hypothetical protein